MKMNYWKFAVLAMVVVALSFTSCSDDGNGGGGDGDEVTLKGDVTSTVTLTANNTYYLDGEYIVKDGGVLRIEAGTKIIAKSEDQTIDFILVEQGGKIMAEGTAEKPIIMTSETEEPGAWGGLHICGRAPINAGNQKSEVGDAPYGEISLTIIPVFSAMYVLNMPGISLPQKKSVTVSLLWCW